MTTNYQEFVRLIENKPLDLVYTFFYNPDGLVDTTRQTRTNLAGRDKIKLSTTSSVVNLPFVTRAFLEFKAIVTPKVSMNKNCSDLGQGEKDHLFAYFLSRDDYYSGVKIKTTSQERYLDTMFLTDKDKDTL